MKRVVIESPFAGDTYRNLRYLRACMADCLRRGESPYASHGLYTQPGVLDDTVPEDRELGIRAGFAWRSVSDATVVYIDIGVTQGMQFGVDDALAKDRPIEYRRLGEQWDRGPSTVARSVTPLRPPRDLHHSQGNDIAEILAAAEKDLGES